MYSHQKRLNTDLKIFLAVIGALTIIGLLFIYSSSSVFALEKFGSATFFVKKQMVGILLGICALIIGRLVPLEFLKTTSPYFFCASLALTALTLIPTWAEHIHGSSRWLTLCGLTFQPSELLKISLILYLSYWLTKETSLKFKNKFLPFVGIMCIVAWVLLKQPDFGMTVTVVVTACIMYFLVQFSVKYLFITLLTLLPTLAMLIYLRPYRWKRVITFLNPWNDPQGAGFQIIQSLIAIGSGSWLGIGVSHSKQKFFYLPMQHTDFIFSIIAEETGFVGSLLLITLYLLFLYCGMRIAWQLKNPFGILVCTGFITLISLQTIINLAVTTGLAPTKGIGLPFVSYGKSSLICCMFMVGLIMNIVHDDY
jgi:cell division protein FtsW